MLYFFISLFDFHRFEYFEVKKSILLPVTLAIVSYYAAAYFAKKRQWSFPLIDFKGKTNVLLYLLGGIGLIAYALMILKGQIGAADESIRRNLDPKLSFLSSLLWYSVLLLFCQRMLKERSIKVADAAMLAAVTGMFLLMGYRTPIIIIFFTSMIAFHYAVRRIKLSWFLTALLVIGITFSLFGFLRVLMEDPTLEFNSREGPEADLTMESEILLGKINATPAWIRALNGESVTGHIVVSKLMEYTEQNGYLNGELHKGIFATVLPGEQQSPRMMVTEMVNSLVVDHGKYITRPGRTTTPTFLGQLFADGGYLAVIIGFALYGVIISMLYNKLGGSHAVTVAYAFVTSVFMISLHTGLLDLIFLLMIGFAIVSAGGVRETG